jgi:hypothetical protein
MKKILLLTLCSTISYLYAQEIFPVSSGLNGPVHVVYPYGAGILVGGEFTNAGGNQDADYFACWNGTSWCEMIPGLNGPVYAIEQMDGNIFIGGSFTQPYQYVALFDSNELTWWGIGNMLGGPVTSLAKGPTPLFSIYAGGLFEGKVALYAEGHWTLLGGGVDGVVDVLAIKNQDLYVGGKFNVAQGASKALDIWSNGAWQNIPQPSDIQHVYDLAMHGDDLYLCGYPTTYCQGGMGGDHEPIMQWDGNNYSTLGHFGGCRIASEMVVHDRHLYVDAIDPLGEQAVFAWDLYYKDWDGFLTYFEEEIILDQILCMTSVGSDVFIGGYFTDHHGSFGDHIVRWGKQIISSTAISTNSDVSSLRVSPNPTQNSIRFEVTGDLQPPYIVIISDVHGNIPMQFTTIENQIDISRLEMGVYFLQVRNAASYGVARVIKL